MAEPGLVIIDSCCGKASKLAVAPMDSVGAGLRGVFGEAEVENFCLAARSDEDIRGLDIAMNDAAGMSGVERIGNLNREIEERGKRNRAAADSFAERLAFEQLHDEKWAAIRFAYVEERADAGMIQRGDGARFALKAFERGGIVSEFAGEKFQRDEAAETNIFGAEDLAHAAAAERFDDAIMRECLADQERASGQQAIVIHREGSRSKLARKLKSERHLRRISRSSCGCGWVFSGRKSYCQADPSDRESTVDEMAVIIGTGRAAAVSNLERARRLELQHATMRRSAGEAMSDLAQSLTWGRDEAELVNELQAGSDAAFEWLVTYYHASVYNLVYGILSDSADAADVTQEVFLRAFRGIRGFRRGSSLKTWLYRISVREALNHRRWCWRHHRQQISIDDDSNGTAAAMELEDLDATPYDRLATRETQSAVRKALAQVPDVFRGAVILRDLEGLSYEEVAEILEISVGTVKSRILRGRRALREILDPLLHARARLATTESRSHRASSERPQRACRIQRFKFDASARAGI